MKRLLFLLILSFCVWSNLKASIELGSVPEQLGSLDSLLMGRSLSKNKNILSTEQGGSGGSSTLTQWLWALYSRLANGVDGDGGEGFSLVEEAESTKPEGSYASCARYFKPGVGAPEREINQINEPCDFYFEPGIYQLLETIHLYDGQNIYVTEPRRSGEVLPAAYWSHVILAHYCERAQLNVSSYQDFLSQSFLLLHWHSEFPFKAVFKEGRDFGRSALVNLYGKSQVWDVVTLAQGESSFRLMSVAAQAELRGVGVQGVYEVPKDKGKDKQKDGEATSDAKDKKKGNKKESSGGKKKPVKKDKALSVPVGGGGRKPPNPNTDLSSRIPVDEKDKDWMVRVIRALIAYITNATTQEEFEARFIESMNYLRSIADQPHAQDFERHIRRVFEVWFGAKEGVDLYQLSQGFVAAWAAVPDRELLSLYRVMNDFFLDVIYVCDSGALLSSIREGRAQLLLSRDLAREKAETFGATNLAKELAEADENDKKNAKFNRVSRTSSEASASPGPEPAVSTQGDTEALKAWLKKNMKMEKGRLRLSDSGRAFLRLLITRMDFGQILSLVVRLGRVKSFASKQGLIEQWYWAGADYTFLVDVVEGFLKEFYAVDVFLNALSNVMGAQMYDIAGLWEGCGRQPERRYQMASQSLRGVAVRTRTAENERYLQTRMAAIFAPQVAVVGSAQALEEEVTDGDLAEFLLLNAAPDASDIPIHHVILQSLSENLTSMEILQLAHYLGVDVPGTLNFQSLKLLKRILKNFFARGELHDQMAKVVAGLRQIWGVRFAEKYNSLDDPQGIRASIREKNALLERLRLENKEGLESLPSRAPSDNVYPPEDDGDSESDGDDEGGEYWGTEV